MIYEKTWMLAFTILEKTKKKNYVIKWILIFDQRKKKKKGTNLIHEISWRNECVKLTPNTCSYEYNFFFYKKDHNLNILEKERKKKHKMGYCL